MGEIPPVNIQGWKNWTQIESQIGVFMPTNSLFKMHRPNNSFHKKHIIKEISENVGTV